MIRVGNDVVDLGDPAIAGPPRLRFIERVCAEEERARIFAAPDPAVLLWTLFAAKEAAYKVIVKLGPRPPFAHRRFLVAADLAEVRYEAHTLALFVHRQGDRIHAVASTDALSPRWAAGEREGGDDPGMAARHLLCEMVAAHLHCAPDSLSVIRPPVPGSWDGFGPPRLERGGAILPIDISLSHDGRYVACAAALPG